MTPALKAMVEAMAAEFIRQSDQDFAAGAAERDSWSEPPERYLRMNGRFDLEKVARAGMEAIKRVGDFEDVAHAGAKSEPFQMPEGERFTPGRIIAASCWSAMIDAILKDQP